MIRRLDGRLTRLEARSPKHKPLVAFRIHLVNPDGEIVRTIIRGGGRGDETVEAPTGAIEPSVTRSES